MNSDIENILFNNEDISKTVVVGLCPMGGGLAVGTLWWGKVGVVLQGNLHKWQAFYTNVVCTLTNRYLDEEH